MYQRFQFDLRLIIRIDNKNISNENLKKKEKKLLISDPIEYYIS